MWAREAEAAEQARLTDALDRQREALEDVSRERDAAAQRREAELQRWAQGQRGELEAQRAAFDEWRAGVQQQLEQDQVWIRFSFFFSSQGGISWMGGQCRKEGPLRHRLPAAGAGQDGMASHTAAGCSLQLLLCG